MIDLMHIVIQLTLMIIFLLEIVLIAFVGGVLGWVGYQILKVVYRGIRSGYKSHPLTCVGRNTPTDKPNPFRKDQDGME